jgi:hypothetical protein
MQPSEWIHFSKKVIVIASRDAVHRTPHSLLVGMLSGIIVLKDSLVVSLKTNILSPDDPAGNSLLYFTQLNENCLLSKPVCEYL